MYIFMDILKEIIYDQNLDLLQRIANDKFNDEEQKKRFIQKYHKKNFTHLKMVKKNILPKYEKHVQIMKNK